MGDATAFILHFVCLEHVANRLSLHNLSCRILLLSMLLSVFSRSFRNRIVYNQTPVTRKVGKPPAGHAQIEINIKIETKSVAM